MYKVVVIDDNVMFLQSLTVAVDWGALGCAVAGTAENGLEGMALIGRVKPDIVLADIQMPGLDGLEMIQKIHRTLGGAKIVIVTGFEKFDYARRALELHVDAFLLKPLDPQELSSCIGGLVRQLTQEASARRQAHRAVEEHRELQLQRRQRARMELSHLFHRLLHGAEGEGGALLGRLREAGLPDAGYVLACLDVGDGAPRPAQAPEKMERILSHLRRQIPQKQLAEILEASFARLPVLALFYSPQAGAAHFPEFVRNARVALHALTGTGALQGFLLAEEGPQRLEGLRDAARSLAAAMEWRRYTQAPQGQGPGEAGAPPEDGGGDLATYLNRQLDRLENEEEPQQAREALARLTRAIARRANRSLPYFKTAVTLFCFLLLSRSQAGAQEDFYDLDLVADEIQALPHIQAVDSYLIHLYETFVLNQNKPGEGCPRRGENYSPLIRALLRYVRGHLCEDISLQKAAQALSVSPNYLSSRIKKETGENFSHIVLRAKMAFAKKQLSTTKLKIEEIGAMVGYQNYISFYKVFKRSENLSPKEYRERFLL